MLELLGTINDAAVTADHARALASDDGAGLGAPAVALLGWNEQRRRDSLRKLKRRWRRFQGEEPFWS